jgi:putative sterol carrier protein
MTERTFHDVLSGALPWPRAMMTGRVRMTGDGGYGLVVGGIVGGLRQILSGWPRLAARLLRPDEVPT